MKKNKRVLVTGSSGFIGKHLVKELIDNDIECFGYDLKDGQDIRNEFQLDSMFFNNKFDAVIHLAALAGTVRSNDYPHEYISTNISGTQNVIKCCQKYKIGKLISYSSSSVLGGNRKAGRGLRESDNYDPVNIYGVTKVAGELLIKDSGLNYVIIRPFTVYGPGGRPDMVIYKWINQVKGGEKVTFYGDGTTKRGYTFVLDLVKGTRKVLEKDISNVVLHLGGSEIITLRHLHCLFKSYCDGKFLKCEKKVLKIPDGDVKSSYANTKLAKKLIGFNPKPRFDELLKNILRWEL